MPKYQIESPDGAKYLIESETELDSAQLAQYAENPNFDVPAPANNPSPALQQKEGYLSNIGKYWTEDLPEAGKNLWEGLKDRSARVEAPTTFGPKAQDATGTTGVTGQIVNSVASTPERLIRLFGGTVGELGQVAGEVVNLGAKAVDNVAGGLPGKVLKPVGDKIGEFVKPTVEKISAWYEKLPEEEKANLSTSLDLLDALFYDSPNIAGNVLKNAGDVSTKGGKKVLQSTLKVKDTTAKLAGRNVNEGVGKIIDDVVSFDLQSTTGGIKEIEKKAQDAIDTRMLKNDKILSEYATQNPTAGVNVTISLNELAKNIQDGKVRQIFTNEDEAAAFIGKINEALEKRGLHGYQTVDKLPEIKTVIKDGLKAFSDGKFAIGDAPVKEFIGDLSYLKLTDDIGKHIPEYNAINKEIHDLINVKTAMSEAQKRIGNKNNIGLSDLFYLFGGAPALNAMGIPPQFSTMAPLVAGAVVGKKALGNGRGASAMIDAGNVLDAAGDAVKNSSSASGSAAVGVKKKIESSAKKQDETPLSESASEYVNSHNIQSSGLSTEFRKWFNNLPKGSDRAKAYKEFQTAFKNKRRSKE